MTLPPAVRKSIEAFYSGEWHRLELPESLGGYGATPSLRWASLEMVQRYTHLSPDHKARAVERIASAVPATDSPTLVPTPGRAAGGERHVSAV